MNVLQYLKDNFVYLDGATGTLLQDQGLPPDKSAELWNLEEPDKVIQAHKSYFDAGTNIVCSNTFTANSLVYNDKTLDKIIAAAIQNARKAAELSSETQEKFVALDVGPLGKLLKPFGEIEFEDAVEIFAKKIKLGVKHGVDLIYIATMNDSYETKAALLAAKENCSLPIFVSNTFDQNGKLMTGATPKAMIAMLEAMGADAIGVNCSLGPKQLVGVLEDYLRYSSLPIILKPNAGLPQEKDGKTVFDVNADEFCQTMQDFAKRGVRILGGCCGTTPQYIKMLVNDTKYLTPIPETQKNHSLVSSYTHAVDFADAPILIGERINPTGKAKLKEALINNDTDYILKEGITQQENGVHILDVNVGIPEIDEVDVLNKTCQNLQAVIDLPLQIDSSNVDALEAALRHYNGKAMLNSVNGKDKTMEQIFPIVKKYGALVVCLTLDENGIPDKADERVDIAKKIIAKAEKFGIKKKDLIFDPLALTIGTNTNAAKITLEAAKKIKEQLGCNTSLGISNVSFGLPNRDFINSTFLTMAFNSGLSAAIINPNSPEIMKAYYSYKALNGQDKNCSNYISQIDNFAQVATSQKITNNCNAQVSDEDSLKNAIIKGLKDQAGKTCCELLKTNEPLDIVNKKIIPALDVVGKGYEDKTMYLPQLLMAAEASQCAFEQIKNHMQNSNQDAPKRCKFVIATVKGDIHDIGKNIVKLILENYGFDVIDLGKDVAPETIVEQVQANDCVLVGLSALMTTTLPSMKETIIQLKKAVPNCKICVGGAVLTQEYADSINADCYAKDAMATVRFALSQ